MVLPSAFRLVASAFVLAMRAVRRNTLRAALTVLGILIGVASVVVVGALGNGVRGSVTEQISKLGSNVIIIFPQSANASGARGAQGQGGRLTPDDGRAILEGSTSVLAWAPSSMGAGQVVAFGNNLSTSLVGTTRSYFTIRAWTFADGGPWDESAETIKERVCVLGATVKNELFGDTDAMGAVVRIGRHPFRVVGVLASKGESSFGRDQDDVVLMPWSTFRTRISGASGPPNAGVLLLSATSEATTDRAVRQATEILRQRHRIGSGKEDDFAVRSQAEFQAFQQAIFGSLAALLVSVAAVSLVVGGIGVMNIMLVSVTERTREIGIRMAIGAREASILAQFLIEAVVLSLFGGTAGVALSVALVYAGARFAKLPMKIDSSSVVLAFATSTAIGLVFGFFPARRAAKLDPIQALRRE